MSKTKMRPKVIHAIETAEPGGAETILVQLADSLREDYEPIGLVMERGWTSSELEKKSIVVECIPLEKSFDMSWVAKAVRFIKNNNVKLIHSHEFSCNAYLTIAAKIARVPIICIAHGKNYYPDKYYRRFAYRRVAALADEFIAVSNDLKKYIVDTISIPESRIRVVHNGVDTDKYNRDQYDTQVIRDKLNLSADDYVIVVLAALFEMKGHKDLMLSLQKLLDTYSDIKVLFVGDGPYRSDLIKLVNVRNLDKIVTFLGFRNDVPEILSISDLFVLPSYSEGLPVSVLEAMAASCPVLATDVGGMREIIDHGVNGYLIPPNNPAAIADAIRFCRENIEQTNLRAQNANQHVCATFSQQTMLQNYLELYQALIPESAYKAAL